MLTDTDLVIFEIENSRWRYPGPRRGRSSSASVGQPATRYYQRPNRLLGEPAALAHDPLLVKRLRRRRDARARQRTAALLAIDA